MAIILRSLIDVFSTDEEPLMRVYAGPSVFSGCRRCILPLLSTLTSVSLCVRLTWQTLNWLASPTTERMPMLVCGWSASLQLVRTKSLSPLLPLLPPLYYPLPDVCGC